MPKFKQMPMEPTQIVMFPVSVEESLPKDSDVRTLSDAMDLLGWSSFEAGYSETGCPAYPPKVLAKILVYGYSKGIRSSRALEDAVTNDKRYIWLAGGLTPDHTTISRFRKDKESSLKEIYKDTVRICAEAGLVLLNVTATDGSKIQAKASKKSLYDEKRIKRESDAIDKIFEEAQALDEKEDEQYKDKPVGKAPDELADAKKRKEKLEEIAKRLKESDCKNISSQDAECRVMKTTSGLRPAYNVQMTVDKENLVILAADVTNQQTDNGLLEGQIKAVEENTGFLPDTSLADTGYSDEATFLWHREYGQDILIPPKEQSQQKDLNNLFASRCFLHDEEKDVLVCPAGKELTFKGVVENKSGSYKVYSIQRCKGHCSFYNECVTCKKKTGRSVQVSVVAKERQAMIQRLKTEEGKKLYSLRQQIVEPVFGNIKSNMGLDRFRLSGISGARSEVWLASIVHNLKIHVKKALSQSKDVLHSSVFSLKHYFRPLKVCLSWNAGRNMRPWC